MANSEIDCTGVMRDALRFNFQVCTQRQQTHSSVTQGTQQSEVRRVQVRVTLLYTHKKS